MNNLKRIEGKTIKSVSENTDGTNSYFIIKFEEGGKVNIVSFLRGDEGVAQLDIDLNGLNPNDLPGKEILKVEEEFDGEFDHLFLHLRGGKKIEITPYSSSPVSTASLDFTLYSGDSIVAENNKMPGMKAKLVTESLKENTYQKWGQYQMSKPQYESGKNTTGVEIVHNANPGSEMFIFDKIAQHFDNVDIESGNTIVINDPEATIDEVSDLLYKYIENGTVYTVDYI